MQPRVIARFAVQHAVQLGCGTLVGQDGAQRLRLGCVILVEVDRIPDRHAAPPGQQSYARRQIALIPGNRPDRDTTPWRYHIRWRRYHGPFGKNLRTGTTNGGSGVADMSGLVRYQVSDQVAT